MRLANFGDEMLSELIEFFIHSAANGIRSNPSHHKLIEIYSNSCRSDEIGRFQNYIVRCSSCIWIEVISTRVNLDVNL